MQKLAVVLAASCLALRATAFAPAARPALSTLPPRTSRWTVRSMSEEVEAPVEEESSNLPMIAETEENIKTTSTVVGALTGFVLGGPIFSVGFAAAANYLATKDDDAGEVTKGIGQTSLQMWNFLLRLDDKYGISSILGKKAAGAVASAKTSLKEGGSGDVVDQIDTALSTATDKLGELNKEYQLGDKAKSALSSAGDLSNQVIDAGLKANAENDYTGKLAESIKEAVNKAKSA